MLCSKPHGSAPLSFTHAHTHTNRPSIRAHDEMLLTVHAHICSQDGVLTTDEMLTGMTLNSVVYEDNRLDGGVYKAWRFLLPASWAACMSCCLTLHCSRRGLLAERLGAPCMHACWLSAVLISPGRQVFDQNSDGKVSLEEWKAPFGDLGPHGEDLKEWTFK
jgi:hypothetical protein